jgi:hypothetical protein
LSEDCVKAFPCSASRSGADFGFQERAMPALVEHLLSKPAFSSAPRSRWCADAGRLHHHQGPDDHRFGAVALNKPVETMNDQEVRSATERVGQAYEKNPRDAVNGVNYANLLRMQGRDAQALAVMQQVAIANPNDRSVLAAYGKAQAAAGQLQQALDTIGRAQTPTGPTGSWSPQRAPSSISSAAPARPASATATRSICSRGTVDPLQSRHVLCADGRSAHRRNLSAPGRRPADCR